MADWKSCNLCPKTFASSGSLCNHRKIHRRDKKHICSQCNKSFTQSCNLKTHSLIHTGEKPHKCTQCNFSTNVVSNLRDYLRKHTGEKPYGATNAITPQLIQTSWRITKGPTLVKSLKDAQCAIIPALKLVTWKITWWGTTQEKSQTSVISATTLAYLLVSCEATWRSTLGKSLSIATYAAKLSVIKKGLHNILRFTWPRSDCWSNFWRKNIQKQPKYPWTEVHIWILYKPSWGLLYLIYVVEVWHADMVT